MLIRIVDSNKNMIVLELRFCKYVKMLVLLEYNKIAIIILPNFYGIPQNT